MSRRKTRAAVVKQSATTAAATVTTIKAVEEEEEEEEQKKKKKKTKASPLPVVETPTIPTPQSREVGSEEEEEDEAIEEPQVVEDRSVRRSLSPAAKRQWELVQKTTEDALRQSLEA
jgi:hypothetical protein